MLLYTSSLCPQQNKRRCGPDPTSGSVPAPAHEANQDREANYASQSYSHVRRTPEVSKTSQIPDELRYARRNAKQSTLGKSARRAYHNPCHVCHMIVSLMPQQKACCATSHTYDIRHMDWNLTGNKTERANPTCKSVVFPLSGFIRSGCVRPAGATKIANELADLIAVGLRAARLCKQR